MLGRKYNFYIEDIEKSYDIDSIMGINDDFFEDYLKLHVASGPDA